MGSFGILRGRKSAGLGVLRSWARKADCRLQPARHAKKRELNNRDGQMVSNRGIGVIAHEMALKQHDVVLFLIVLGFSAKLDLDPGKGFKLRKGIGFFIDQSGNDLVGCQNQKFLHVVLPNLPDDFPKDIQANGFGRLEDPAP